MPYPDDITPAILDAHLDIPHTCDDCKEIFPQDDLFYDHRLDSHYCIECFEPPEETLEADEQAAGQFDRDHKEDHAS